MLLMLAAAVAVVPAGTNFACTPTRVWDGDGPAWCAEGSQLRLAGVVTCECEGAGRSNQPYLEAKVEEARRAL